MMKAYQFYTALTALLHTVKHAEGDLVCPRRSLQQELAPEPAECPLLTFPTGNLLEEASHARLKVALDEAAAYHSRRPLVTFFYGPRCPYSQAWRPVVECAAKFFPPHVRFLAVNNNAEMSSSARLNHGILSTPVLRVTWKGHRTRYTGSRDLPNMVKGISDLTGGTAMFDIRAAQDCFADPECSCQYKAGEVTAADIAELGWNYWMLIAVIFLAAVVLQLGLQQYLKRPTALLNAANVRQQARELLQ